MHNKLLEIIEKKKQDLIEKKRRVSLEQIRKETEENLVNNLFLKNILAAQKIAVIAEIKFASPTNPILGSKEELLNRAKEYEKAGANAISIITEPHFFKGDISFVERVKKEVKLPVLQKDFVIDAYQIYEAKHAGSDALLLIARLVEEKTLQEFVSLSQKLGIEPVVEINSEEDLKKAIKTKSKVISVNARDLETFDVNVKHACELLKKIPDNFVKLGFSGIHSGNEVEVYKKAGANGVLVGTSLMKTKNISEFINSLRVLPEKKVKVKICGVRNLESAEKAIAVGADFLGFNFVPTSKRFIDPENAKKIIDVVREEVSIVGIFQNATVDEVSSIAERLDLDFVQLHGEEDEEYISKINFPIIKKMNHESGIKNYGKKPMLRDSYFILLDRDIQGQGDIVNLEKAKEIAKEHPTFFSGGLTPDNVSEVVTKVKPFAVDVASGIETNGEQDLQKIKQFIHNAKEALL